MIKNENIILFDLDFIVFTTFLLVSITYTIHEIV